MGGAPQVRRDAMLEGVYMTSRGNWRTFTIFIDKSHIYIHIHIHKTLFTVGFT